jgi:acyl-CoA hydrolase
MVAESQQPKVFIDVEALADTVIARIGKSIVLGLPLGLGKANHLANALVKRAQQDSSLSLTIFTALTLEAPTATNELAKRFLEPMQERFFSGYPRLDYARALSEGNLPKNIRVHEFFLQPGQWLGNDQVQQDYVSLNYTYALRFLIEAGVNIIGQLIAAPADHQRGQIATHYSLSCNPDVSADLIDLRNKGALNCLFIGQVNRQLPFMQGAAIRASSDFDFILDHERYEFPLFMPPQEPVTLTDHAIGLHVARLIPDGGTLQIGIGSLGDAVAHALTLRHKHNRVFRECMHQLFSNRQRLHGYETPFTQGLYGLSEMLNEGLLALVNAGIIKRQIDNCVVHAGFFIGSPNFYRMLAEMDDATREKIAMMPIPFINELYDQRNAESDQKIGRESEKRRARVKARFVNSGIMATLTGAIVSDALENGQVISGVGGQHNFVTQAQVLDDASSIITLRATRTHQGKVSSNICWSYGHATIPRHLRDIVITEYGTADLRGKCDADVIAAMLTITDSRFQAELLAKAKHAGKIAADYEIPDIHRHNTPERIMDALAQVQQQGYLDPFPLGSDFTPPEQRLALALKTLRENTGSMRKLTSFVLEGLRARMTPDINECLQRMQLAEAHSPTTLFYRYLLIGALAHTN